MELNLLHMLCEIYIYVCPTEDICIKIAYAAALHFTRFSYTQMLSGWLLKFDVIFLINSAAY